MTAALEIFAVTVIVVIFIVITLNFHAFICKDFFPPLILLFPQNDEVEKALEAMSSQLPFLWSLPPRKTFMGFPIQRGFYCSRMKEMVRNRCGGGGGRCPRFHPTCKLTS